MSSKMYYKGATIDQMLQKLAMETKVELTPLTEKEILFWTTRRTPKKKPVVAVKTHPIPEQKSESDQQTKPQSQEVSSIANTTYQALINRVPDCTPSDIKSEKTGIKRKLPNDSLHPKKIKNISKCKSVNNVEGNPGITRTPPKNQKAVYGNQSITVNSSHCHQNSAAGTFIPVSQSKKFVDLLGAEIENISQSPIQCLKKDLVDGTAAPAPQTFETVEKPSEPFQKSSAFFGEEMNVFEDLFLRLDSYLFSPSVEASVTELSKQFSVAYTLMSEFDLKINKMELNPIVSDMEKSRNISILKLQCQNILRTNHAIGFSTVFLQVIVSFGISFRWELVILLYCKILQNFFRLTNSKNLKLFFEARNLISFLLAASDYKNDMVFKVLNLPHKLFAALITSTLSALKYDVDLRELNQPLDGDWRDKNSMFKDGVLHSNELAYSKPTINNSVQNQYENTVQHQNYMQTVNKSLPIRNQGGMGYEKVPNMDLKSQNDGIIQQSQPGYSNASIRVNQLQNQVSLQQKTQGYLHSPNKQPPNPEKNQQSYSRFPQMPVKGFPPQHYKQCIKQQTGYTQVPNNGQNYQPYNNVNNQQSQFGSAMVPNRNLQSPNLVNILQGTSQLGYSQLNNQGLQAQNQNHMQQSYQQIPNEGLQYQAQVSLQQSTQGYSQIPNKQLQSQKQVRPNYNGEYLFVPNRDQQKNIIQHQQYNPQVTNHVPPPPYPNASQQKQQYYSQATAADPQAANSSILEQLIRQQLSPPPAQKSPQLVQNVPSAASPTTGFHGNGPKHQEMVNKSQPTAINCYKNIKNSQRNNNQYTSTHQRNVYLSTENYSQQNQMDGQSTISAPSKIQTGSMTPQGNPTMNLVKPEQTQMNRPATHITGQHMIQTGSVFPQGNPSVKFVNSQQTQMDRPATVLGQTGQQHMIQTGSVPPQGNPSVNLINQQTQMIRPAAMQSQNYSVPPQENPSVNLINSQQTQIDRPGTVPVQSLNQTGLATPQKSPQSANFKIRVRPLSSLCNDNSEAVHQVKGDAMMADSVIKMSRELMKVGKEVNLCSSTSQPSSVIKLTPSVTIMHKPADATHQVQSSQLRTLPEQPVRNGEALFTTPVRLPSMPSIVEPTPPPTQIVNATVADLHDIVRLPSENRTVTADIEREIKTEPSASGDPFDSSATTSNFQEETSTKLSDGTTLETAEAQIKSEDPEFMSLFGTCSRNGCSMPATCACSKCQKAIYCGFECQKEDWAEGHATICGSKN
ncbi:hypothetical protein LSTR_LSTR000403 [Laodelphax striatellus]|uniref:MYND-type domain-containing protein n=1 Tax=Laodelphax striatellus TaxID=195883 RepID=A0A482X422_LAOST|nr:hypothetical protein LSTR_LSTR000403 [Laodelphax striatellus]